MVEMHTSDDVLAVSLKEAARRLGVSPRTCWTLANAGELPTFRIGARILVPVEALDQFVATRTRRGNRR